jgi:hypothetical protein
MGEDFVLTKPTESLEPISPNQPTLLFPRLALSLKRSA